MVVLVPVARDLVLQRADPLLQSLLGPFRCAHRLVLHYAAVAHVELVLLLPIDLLLFRLCEIALVLYLCSALRDPRLTLDSVVRFITTGDIVSILFRLDKLSEIHTHCFSGRVS